MSNSTFTLYHTRDKVEIIIETTGMVIVFLVGAIANPLIGFVIWKNKKLHNLHNAITINLIITDSLATFLCMPPLIVTFASGKWILGNAICHTVGFLSVVFGICCVWTILWLSISRLLMVFKPRIYALIVMPKYMTAIIASVWAIAIFSGGTAYMLGEYKFKSKFAVCFLYFHSIPGLIAFMLPFVVLPLSGISIATAAIFIKIKKRCAERKQGTHKEESSIVSSYILLVVVYIFCYLPVFIIEVKYTTDKSGSMPHICFTIATFLGMAPFSIKTFLNVLSKKNFRQEVCLFFSKKNRVDVHPYPNIRRAWQKSMLNAKKNAAMEGVVENTANK